MVDQVIHKADSDQESTVISWLLNNKEWLAHQPQLLESLGLMVSRKKYDNILDFQSILV